MKSRPEWAGQDLDADDVRSRFRIQLRRSPNGFTTPYWNSGFINWLVYEGTINPCGLRVKSIEELFVTLCAHCAGVQTEGICLDATFKVPTRMFKTPDLVKMIGPYRYRKNGPVCRFEWFPRLDDRRIAPCNITELVWWYDESYDETEDRPDAGHAVTGEETCYKCDVQIKYRIKDGKTVVVCPECGAINPICNECTRPEHENGACHECELFRDCERLNNLMAKGVGK